jgi:hypothetical protein
MLVYILCAWSAFLRVCVTAVVCLQVRGKDFRHEKTKKKRGTYRGGDISLNAVCSVKLGSDSD